jgi:hypothetical protein
MACGDQQQIAERAGSAFSSAFSRDVVGQGFDLGVAIGWGAGKGHPLQDRQVRPVIAHGGRL